MTEPPLGEGELRSLDRVLTSSGPGVDVGFRQGSIETERAALRPAYLVQQFACRVFHGDYQRAAEFIERPHQLLGDRSPRNMAATDSGMLVIRRLLSQMAWHSRHRGLAKMVQALC